MAQFLKKLYIFLKNADSLENVFFTLCAMYLFSVHVFFIIAAFLIGVTFFEGAVFWYFLKGLFVYTLMVGGMSFLSLIGLTEKRKSLRKYIYNGHVFRIGISQEFKKEWHTAYNEVVFKTNNHDLLLSGFQKMITNKVNFPNREVNKK